MKRNKSKQSGEMLSQLKQAFASDKQEQKQRYSEFVANLDDSTTLEEIKGQLDFYRVSVKAFEEDMAFVERYEKLMQVASERDERREAHNAAKEKLKQLQYELQEANRTISKKIVEHQKETLGTSDALQKAVKAPNEMAELKEQKPELAKAVEVSFS